MKAPAPRAHAPLSASAADRWMNCPASFRLSQGFPRQSSTYAAEGEAAHTLCEETYRLGMDPRERIGETIRTEDGQEIEVTDEMAEAAAGYAKLLEATAPAEAQRTGEIMVFQEYQLTTLGAIDPLLGGSLDFGCIDSFTACVHALDLKYGKGVVVNPDCAQLRLYALGLLGEAVSEIEAVWLSVYQPRAVDAKGQTFRTVCLPVAELEAWRDRELIPAIARAKDPNAQPVAGEWCRFCPAAGGCPAKAELRLVEARAAFGVTPEASAIHPPPVETLTVPQALKVLHFFEALGDYPEQVKGYLQTKAMAGDLIEGFKLVAKRANRRWTDEGKAEDALRPSLGDKVYEPKALLSPAKMEKALKAAKLDPACIAPLVEKPDNGLTLVSVTDKRPEITPDAAKGRQFIDHLAFMS